MKLGERMFAPVTMTGHDLVVLDRLHSCCHRCNSGSAYLGVVPEVGQAVGACLAGMVGRCSGNCSGSWRVAPSVWQHALESEEHSARALQTRICGSAAPEDARQGYSQSACVAVQGPVEDPVYHLSDTDCHLAGRWDFGP